jgi:dihydrofolate reductase
MRKIILQVAVSLDNYIEGAHGEYDWCFTDQDYGMTDFIKRVDAIFYGRKSYDMMQTATPESDALWKDKKSYVFSNTLKKRNDYELIAGDIKSPVNAIKQQQGKDIWLFGGASIAVSLLNAGLVDEIVLAVHPIILGAGKPLFAGVEKRVKTKLIKAKPYDTGLVMMTYAIEN